MLSKITRCKTALVIVLIFCMMASILATGLSGGITVNAATNKTVTVIYTGTENADLYLDGYQTSSYQDTWELVSANSNFTYSETTDANGYTVYSVSFDFDSIYSVDLKTNIGDWNWVGFTWNDISGGSTTKYVYADGTVGTEAPATEEGGDSGEEETPVGPTSTSTVTFAYVGSTDGVTADNLWFYMNWAEGTLATSNAGNLDAFSITKSSAIVDGYSAVVLTGSNVESELKNMWLNVGIDGQIGESISLAFDGTVYYVSDDSYSTTAPSTDIPVVTNTYTLNVHVYGQDAEVGAWPILVENGSETAWGTTKTASGTLNGDWTDITITYNSSSVYTNVGAQLIDNGTWLSTQYKLPFNGTTCDMWIVPDAGTCYDNEADALAAAADPATSTKVIIHYKKTSGTMGGWVVGSWFTSAINGNWGSKDTVFSYQDDWGYVAVVNYSQVVNEIEFKIHRRAKIDGVANDWYKEEGNNRKISINNGFAEVWVTQGKNAISYTCPSGATKFSTATAEKFKNYRYLLIETAKGEDADLVFHYLRSDGIYDDWTVGLWAEVTADNWKNAQITKNAELDEYGAATYTVSLNEWPKTEIGFAVNYNNWAMKDYDGDRYVDVSDVEAGQILHVYLYENDGTIYYEPKTSYEFTEKETGPDSDVVFHYNRAAADYEGWMVGLWCEKSDGTWVNDNVAFDGTDAEGNATVTVDLAKFPSATLGFKLNKDNWAEEDGGDRSLDLTGIADGMTIDVYLYQDDICVYFESKNAQPEEPVVTKTDVVSETDAAVTEEEDNSINPLAVIIPAVLGLGVLLTIFFIILAKKKKKNEEEDPTEAPAEEIPTEESAGEAPVAEEAAPIPVEADVNVDKSGWVTISAEAGETAEAVDTADTAESVEA